MSERKSFVQEIIEEYKRTRRIARYIEKIRGYNMTVDNLFRAEDALGRAMNEAKKVGRREELTDLHDRRSAVLAELSEKGRTGLR